MVKIYENKAEYWQRICDVEKGRWRKDKDHSWGETAELSAQLAQIYRSQANGIREKINNREDSAPAVSSGELEGGFKIKNREAKNTPVELTNFERNALGLQAEGVSCDRGEAF